MNQPTHAWLAVEAYRKIETLSKTPAGKKKKLEGLAHVLGENLRDVVVAAWLPDSLIKDMTYGHVFKNSKYDRDDEQVTRFTLSKEGLTERLAPGALTPKAAFDCVPAGWWKEAYRVKDKGGHLPARVNALCQTARDMFKMGDKEVTELTGVKPPGAAPIAQQLLFSHRDIAMNLWMASHYIADAHMPFHCDNRALASTAAQKTHGAIEDEWGKQVPKTFHSSKILKMPREDILAVPLPDGSQFARLKLGDTLGPLENNGDPWLESIYICRASFAVSFALVPHTVAPVDDKKTKVGLSDILAAKKECCGEARFWEISRGIMTDAANAIARFWQDAWWDFVQAAEKKKKNG